MDILFYIRELNIQYGNNLMIPITSEVSVRGTRHARSSECQARTLGLHIDP